MSAKSLPSDNKSWRHHALDVYMIWTDTDAGKRIWFFNVSGKLMFDFIDAHNLTRNAFVGGVYLVDGVYLVNGGVHIRILKIQKADNDFLTDKGSVFLRHKLNG